MDLVPLGGLGVAALALLLTYRERAAAYRHRFYERQLESMTEVWATFAAFCKVMGQRLSEEVLASMAGPSPDLNAPLDDAAKGRIRTACDEAWDEWLQIERKNAPMLPTAVEAALEAFRNVAIAVVAPAALAGTLPSDLVLCPEPETPVSAAYQRVLTAVRDAMGTDPLTAANESLIGHLRQERLSADPRPFGSAKPDGQLLESESRPEEPILVRSVQSALRHLRFWAR